MKKSQKLIFNPDYDFKVIAIVSQESEFRMCWLLNEKFNFAFTKANSISFHYIKTNTFAEFPVFTYFDSSTGFKLDLISNKYQAHSLLEDFKNIDYIVKISGLDTEFDFSVFVKDLKSIEEIITAQEIQIDNENSKQKLLF